MCSWIFVREWTIRAPLVYCMMQRGASKWRPARQLGTRPFTAGRVLGFRHLSGGSGTLINVKSQPRRLLVGDPPAVSPLLAMDGVPKVGSNPALPFPRKRSLFPFLDDRPSRATRGDKKGLPRGGRWTPCHKILGVLGQGLGVLSQGLGSDGGDISPPPWWVRPR